ncbi:MAG: hypothetical protein ACLSBA_06525 [Adlercreutzia equolifaciens]
MVSRFEYHGKESLMEKRRQRRKEQLRNRTVALAAGLLLAGVCGVSSALAATGGSDGFDVVDVLQDTASLSAAPSSLVPAEDDALWQVAAEGGSDAALKEIASRGANLLAARSGGQRAVEGMRITTALIKVEGVLDQNLANDSSFSVDFNKQFTLHIEVESELNLANKKVEITVPDGLTVVEYPIPERGDMAESVTPESIDQLHSVNNYGGYHPTNGTITYSLKIRRKRTALISFWPRTPFSGTEQRSRSLRIRSKSKSTQAIEHIRQSLPLQRLRANTMIRLVTTERSRPAPDCPGLA